MVLTVLWSSYYLPPVSAIIQPAAAGFLYQKLSDVDYTALTALPDENR
jgi:hypothetical protein